MSREELNLSTSSATFCMKENPHRERFTVIIIGTPRGGTSAVAGVVHRLGIPMGENLPNNYEDPDFKPENRGNFREVITARNEQHAVWGFKFPNAGSYLEGFAGDFINPVLVIVERDAAASLKRIMRRQTAPAIDVMTGILKRKLDNARLAKSLEWPLLYVSYEKLVQYKSSAIAELAAFLNQDLSAEQSASIEPFLQPGSYK
jgi:hypothetical protein